MTDKSLYDRLNKRNSLSQFQIAVGSTYASESKSKYIIGDDDHTPDDAPSNTQVVDEAILLNNIIKESNDGTFNLDDIMVNAVHAGRHQGVNAKDLAKIWRIDENTAKKTLDITSQRCVRKDNPKLSRNFSTNDRTLRYKHLKEYFYMDTLYATKDAGKSSRGNKCAQLFVTDKGFVYIVPMKSESQVLHAVKQFAKCVGAPDAIIHDASKAQKKNAVKQFCNDIGTTLRVLEENTPWANKAELYIGIIKEAVRKDMKESNCPLAFWDYCMERRARINNLTAKNLFSLHGSNAYTSLTGDEGDISALCKFGWYEWCYFRDNTAKFPFNREVLGKVLGPASGEGNEMAQWVLKANGQVVPRRSLRSLQVDELHSLQEIKKREIFVSLIERRWGTSASPPPISPLKNNADELSWEEYHDQDEPARHIPEVEDMVRNDGKLICQQPAYDRIINAEVLLQNGDELQTAKVLQRSVGPNGLIVGKYDDNPALNSMIYDLEFPDGAVKEYSANIIAENMLTQVDSDGFTMTMMEGIIDHKKDTDVAVSKNDMYVVTRRGQQRLRITTCGWKLLIRWKDGSESWIHLKDLKESHPVETAEYAKARGIADEPAFAWWVPYTMRKRDIILSAVKSRLRKTTHKYGIEIPTSIAHSEKIDEKNKNLFWRDAIALEMQNNGVAFNIQELGTKAPPGWSKVTGHLIFDVKMDFTRKARWVLDGHRTPDPIGSSYAR